MTRALIEANFLGEKSVCFKYRCKKTCFAREIFQYLSSLTFFHTYYKLLNKLHAYMHTASK